MPPKSREERLFGASCLKLKLEKTVGQRAAAVEIYQDTLRDLGLSEEDVDAYVDAHRGEIEAALASGRRHGG
jgi:hypothetical protein